MILLCRNILKFPYKSYKKSILKAFFCTNTKNNDIARIRNIGISAHIDAGKTTTTERMLFYSGKIEQMGEVHDGNTVTDFMEQERERGITITSAAVTFNWKNHQFNLIDTPGHIDFTMEVEQTLNVLDGVVVILDGSAGVEAQTLTVWRQADRYNLPRLIYVNKMDRLDSNIYMCCQTVEKKFDTPVALLQLPFIENNKFLGVVDVLSLELTKYCEKSTEKIALSEKIHGKLFEEAHQARLKVIEKISDLNEELANKIIESESFDAISSIEIVKSLKETTHKREIVPIVLGSSYKNIGVQSLMDSIILYLPSPENRSEIFHAFGEHFCGRTFKVRHDKQRGSLVFVRLYNGQIKKGQKIFSVQKNVTEQVGRIFIPYADDFKEVNNLGNGNIAVLSGLKHIVSGDLVTSSQSAYEKAKRKASTQETSSNEAIFGINARIPEPVFFCSIEPPSMSTQQTLERALEMLHREDPSLRVTFNQETGQTVLAGMGELHLEIIRDRILKEYKIEADLGPLQIAYREAPLENVTDSLKIDTRIGNVKNSVLCKLSLICNDDGNCGDVLIFDKTAENASNIAAIRPRHLNALKQGVEIGLCQGPKINSQIINANIMLHWLEVTRSTSETILSSTVTNLIQKLLAESGTCILEPVMNMEIVVPSEYLSVVLSDLSRRRTCIKNVSMRGTNSKLVNCTAPLAELLGYSTHLRTISSGTATFTTEFFQYQRMSSAEENEAIKSVRGF